MMPFVLPDGDQCVPGLFQLIFTVKSCLVGVVPCTALKLLVWFGTALRMAGNASMVKTAMKLIDGVGHGIITIHAVGMSSNADDITG